MIQLLAIEMEARLSSPNKIVENGDASDDNQTNGAEKVTKPISNDDENSHDIKCILIYLKDPALHLAEELDIKDFSGGFSFIWNQWTSKPYVKVEGWGWLFKLFLWCLR